MISLAESLVGWLSLAAVGTGGFQAGYSLLTDQVALALRHKGNQVGELSAQTVQSPDAKDVSINKLYI